MRLFLLSWALLWSWTQQSSAMGSCWPQNKHRNYSIPIQKQLMDAVTCCTTVEMLHDQLVWMKANSAKFSMKWCRFLSGMIPFSEIALCSKAGTPWGSVCTYNCCHCGNAARNVYNAVVALPTSSSDTCSSGEWLIPPRHLTNSMPICTVYTSTLSLTHIQSMHTHDCHWSAIYATSGIARTACRP